MTILLQAGAILMGMTLASTAVYAQSKTGVVCNGKSAATNVRSGPTAKGTIILAALPNNSHVVILERVRNPEGSHEWARVKYRSSVGASESEGYVLSEFIAGECDKAPQPAQQQASSHASRGISLSGSPKGSGRCSGFIVPANLLNRQGVLIRDFTANDIMSVTCSQQGDGNELVIRLRLPERTLRSGENCYADIRVTGSRPRGQNFVDGEAYVSTSNRLMARGCNENYALVQGETPTNNFNYRVFIGQHEIFKSKADFETAQRNRTDTAPMQASPGSSSSRPSIGSSARKYGCRAWPMGFSEGYSTEFEARQRALDECNIRRPVNTCRIESCNSY